ncbi:cortex morphogenetic protein CmpA [Thermoflavimicrobium daqui]|uniref:Cortex morphogenetic protein CmpA n=1 Tax=Thermoflavimicrobium daqui TaxID=2137476 RepID=A0A364K1Y4_9BACL|nr:cortex morphogenetic protein CmpA [Thermoflavimicrobium daqui]RAL22039.1 cortex morphogenetic protein CmpA [Thermoflavimicrobium daqui]
MPRWLIKQLKQAFYNRDRRQIRFLNQCWFSFYEKEYTRKKKQSASF